MTTEELDAIRAAAQRANSMTGWLMFDNTVRPATVLRMVAEIEAGNKLVADYAALNEALRDAARVQQTEIERLRKDAASYSDLVLSLMQQLGAR